MCVTVSLCTCSVIQIEQRVLTRDDSLQDKTRELLVTAVQAGQTLQQVTFICIYIHMYTNVWTGETLQ